jgi:hypothetical protein
MITFSEITQIDYKICSKELNLILEYIKSILASINYLGVKTDKFEVRGNEYNWSLRLSTKSDELSTCILKCILADVKCCYLEINKIIHKDGKYKDILDLEYHPLSFRQPDNNIRNKIITFFQNNIIADTRINTLVCIGGECTLFGRIFKSISRKYFLTDYKSIYDDLIWNYSDYSDYQSYKDIALIDYNTCYIEWDKYSRDGGMCIIANTGYQGLGIHLAEELIRSNAERIYIVSCNETSFQNDYLILGTRFRIDSKKEIKTNYSVWIYKLNNIN